MNKLIANSLAVTGLMAFAASVSAGSWEVWTDRKGAEITVVSVFSGDGKTEEAQLDLQIDGRFQVVDTKTLWGGSVCVAVAEKGMLRSVPPSGAGNPLPSDAKEACMFTLRMGANPKRGSDLVKISLAECSSSFEDELPCATKVQAVK